MCAANRRGFFPPRAPAWRSAGQPQCCSPAPRWFPGIGSTLVAGPLLAIPALATLAGGLVGALMASGVSEADAHFYAEGVRRGGALVAVRAQNDEQAARAAEILKRNCAVQQNQRAEVQ